MNKKLNLLAGLFLTVIFSLAACVPAYAATPPNPAVPNNPGSGVAGTGFYGRGGNRGQGGFSGGTILEPLTQSEADGLVRAIQEEIRAQALYQSIVEEFGDTFPFNRIAVSEGQHAAQLVRLAEKYGVAVPAASGSEFPSFDSLADACQAGVEAEIADAALYDELMTVTSHADLLRVYSNLKIASLNNHLPAFQACQ